LTIANLQRRRLLRIHVKPRARVKPPQLVQKLGELNALLAYALLHGRLQAPIRNWSTPVQVDIIRAVPRINTDVASCAAPVLTVHTEHGEIESDVVAAACAELVRARVRRGEWLHVGSDKGGVA